MDPTDLQASPASAELALFTVPTIQFTLISYARQILDALVRGQSLPAHPSLSPAIAVLHPGLFVTLKSSVGLRGCIGQLTGKSDILSTIRELAYSAAFEDPRFYPVQESELSDIRMELSILTQPCPVSGWQEIQLGDQGIRLRLRGRQAVFLPHVAGEQGWDLPATLRALAAKAGLDQDDWRNADCRFEVFWAIHFGEP